MTHRLIIRAQAEADITDAAIWYQNQQSGLGREFLAEVTGDLIALGKGRRQAPGRQNGHQPRVPT
jgi:hypothetical protein